MKKSICFGVSLKRQICRAILCLVNLSTGTQNWYITKGCRWVFFSSHLFKIWPIRMYFLNNSRGGGAGTCLASSLIVKWLEIKFGMFMVQALLFSFLWPKRKVLCQKHDCRVIYIRTVPSRWSCLTFTGGCCMVHMCMQGLPYSSQMSWPFSSEVLLLSAHWVLNSDREWSLMWRVLKSLSAVAHVLAYYIITTTLGI